MKIIIITTAIFSKEVKEKIQSNHFAERFWSFPFSCAHDLQVIFKK